MMLVLVAEKAEQQFEAIFYLFFLSCHKKMEFLTK